MKKVLVKCHKCKTEFYFLVDPKTQIRAKSASADDSVEQYIVHCENEECRSMFKITIKATK